MKARNLVLGLLLGAVVLLPACSSKSPTAPPASPTPVAYSISLTAAPSEALVNNGIVLSAHVTAGSANVPDNTSVTFTITGCVPTSATTPHFENGTCEMARTTSAGIATATIVSAIDGVFEVVVRVPNVTAKINLRWSQPVNPTSLALYSITPNRGRSEGGEQVTIHGRGLATPVAVDFIVSSGVLHAQVLTVSAGGDQVTVVTPAVPGTVTAEVVADVRVTAAAGTSAQIIDTLTGGFTYQRPFSQPQIYTVDPARGSYTGGEQVTIYGANFFAPVRVQFGAEDGQVASVSSDNARITVLTPRHPGGHLTQELSVTVTVTTNFGTTQAQTATLANGYTYVPDTGVPLLYNVIPSKGSPRGGEPVVLTGRNFTQPVKVEFIVGAPVSATLPATIQSVNADGTQIVLTTPQASPQPLPDDTLADIRITNLVGSASSQTATFTGVFTYLKEAKDLNIYGIVPASGQAAGGDKVVIAGTGFVQPVKVEFIVQSSVREAQIVSVNDSGTAIIATTPASPVDVQTQVVADVRVIAAAGTPVEKQATLPAAFTYERPFDSPRIYTVSPDKGSYDGGDQVTIYGANFFTPLRVAFGTELAEVLSNTQTQIVVTTPHHLGQFITQEQTVAVTVATRFDTLLQQVVTQQAAFTYLPNTGLPQLYTVQPSRGSPRGGEPVTLSGKNFNQPLKVEFIIGPPVNATLPASVVSVDSTSTQAVITTPQASPNPLPTDASVDIRITNLVGTANPQTATFAGVFVYNKEAKDIVVYSVDPTRGSSTGGDTVTIHGAGFVAPAQVDFIVGSTAHSAQVTSVTDSTIVCMTPAVPGQTTDEVTADVKVTAAFGLPTQKDATLAGAFTFQKPFAAPQIYTIVPNAIVANSAPYPVTIYGANFFAPLHVTLGSEDATVQSVSTDLSTLQILTPLHSGGAGTVDVTVFTKYGTQQVQQAVRTGGFTWRDPVTKPGTPVIYSINPNKGVRTGHEDVVILGQDLCAAYETATGKCTTAPTVQFVLTGSAPLGAQVTQTADDGRSIHVLTPEASPNPLQADTYATVVVTNPTGTTQLANGFIYLRDDSPLAIYSLTPNRGTPIGGQTVTIAGRGFVGPIVNVDFVIQGVPRAGQVQSFNSAGDEIVVTTPATGVDSTVEQVADVRVTVAVGTANQRATTLTAAYTYDKRYPAPLIYSIQPNRGTWAGGESIQITGANFVKPWRVQIGGEDAQVADTTSPASLLTVTTPIHANTHLTADRTVDVTVSTSFETAQQQTATLAGGFTWIPDTGVPLLYGVSPNQGSPRGNDSVTLTGKNFTTPVDVKFLLGAPLNSTLEATVTSVSADGSTIVLKTPQASPTPVTQQVVCAIQITNLVGSAASQNATFQGVFTYTSESDLAIYQVQPNRGAALGGDQVTITGTGFIQQVAVNFVVGGVTRSALVGSVGTDGKTIVVTTPASGVDSTVEQTADIQVTVASGTANQKSTTMSKAFTYEKYFAAPAIYAVTPNVGSYAGNELVTIVGANFIAPLRVYFGTEEASVDSTNSTTSSLVVHTPTHTSTHLTADQVVDVKVITRFDTAQQQQVTQAQAFTWKPDTGVPLLYSVTPSKGDPRGGEGVTLAGKNFTQPVTVEFILGAPLNVTYPATVTSVDAAGATMTITTPQASVAPLTQEVQVDIRITNLVGSGSSQTATFAKVFTYKTESDLAIYSVNPNRGSPTGAQSVTILGRGFTAPVNVFFVVGGAARQAQVNTATSTATSLQITTPASNVDASVEQVADVRVDVAAGTANQKSATLPAAYTYEKQYSAPSIYAVVPNRGSYSGNETVTISGANFFPPLRVSLGSEDVTIVSNTTSQIVIKTPVHDPSHLTQDQTVDVTVKTNFETAQQQQAVLTGGFTWVPDTGVPLLYSVTPSKGSPRGNEQIILVGKNFTAPVTVEFILGAPLATTLPATVTDVSGDGTQITIKTPQASPTPVTTDVVTDIRITNLVGSASSKNATFTGVFTYIGESRPPLIYFVLPNQGSPRGGETVTIFGRFFLTPMRVQFSFTANGAAKVVDADVSSVSADGTQIVVVTPMASLQPLTADAPADIKITSQYGTGRDETATLDQGFLYVAEHPTPELYSLTPNSGPIEGGTRVTITGTGFQYPVQVFFTIPTFGAIQAAVSSVNFTSIVVTSPSITPMAPNTPTIAQVSVINMETGKTSGTLPFRYGNAIFISSISPGEGPDIGGTQVTLFGQGFVAPVAVSLAGVAAQVLTVSGTEIVVKSAAPTERTCSPSTGPSVVTNIDSNLSATGPNWTYQPARPLITSVDVFQGATDTGTNIIQEHDPTRSGLCASNPAYNTYTVHVHGQNFEQYKNSAASAMTVVFTNPAVEVLTTWVSSTEVTFVLPDLSSVVLDKAACTVNGAAGLRDIPTGIPFTIKNNNNGCSDSLSPALIINPCDPNCKSGVIQVTLAPTSLSLGVGTTGTMTACISAVQSTDTSVTIQHSGSSGIINFTYNAQVNQDSLTLTIPAGQVCQSFTINAITGGTVGVVASLPIPLGGGTATANVTVGALGISLSPSSLNLPVGGVGNLTIQLSAPAPVNLLGGAPILVAQAGAINKIDFGPMLASQLCYAVYPGPTVACNTLGSHVTSFWLLIPSGSSTFSFPVNGNNAGGPITVSATLDPSLGGAIAISTVVVGQYHVSLSPASINIPVGGNASFTVSLDAPAFAFSPAPICGIQVAITQTGPGGVITFTADPDGPTSGSCGPAGSSTGSTGYVTIPNGAQNANFTVNGISGGGPVTVTVSLPAGVGGATASSTVTVSTYIVTLAPKSLLLPVGGIGNFTVTLNSPADAAGVRVYLTQTGQSGIIDIRKADGTSALDGTAPNQYVTIPFNNTIQAFTAVGQREGGPVTITATLDPTKGTSTDSAQVTVGTLTLSATPASVTVPEHGSNTFILTLSKALTADTVVHLSSSNAAVAFTFDGTYPPAVQNTVTILAGSLTSPPVHVYGVNLGPATIYASLDASLGGATAQVAVTVTQAIVFIPSALTVPTGSLGTFTLQLASALSTPLVIQLDYSGTGGAVTGPATVTMLANANTVQFSVWGMKPTTTPVSIVATMPTTPNVPPGLAGATATGTVTVSGAPYALTFNPSTINLPVGASTNMTASFNYPLPPLNYGITYPLNLGLAMSAPGSTVIWINGDAAPANDRFTFTDPGQQTADVPVTITGETNGGPVTITGVGPVQLGSPTTTATATVGPATITLTMTPSPFMWIPAGPTPILAGPITLAISPTQGTNTIVQLQSSDANVVTVPSSVTITAGSSSVTFQPTIVNTGTATITATIPSSPAPAGAHAMAATVSTSNTITFFTVSRSPATLTIPAGGSDKITLTLSNPLATSLSGVTVTGPAAVTVPSSVTIPAGVTSYDIPVTAAAPGSGNITITMPATVGGAALPTTAVTVSPLTFVLQAVSATVYVGSSTTATVTASAPVPSDAIITLSQPAGSGNLAVPGTVTIPSGSTATTFTVTGLALSSPTRTLRATPPVSLSSTPSDVIMTIANLPLTLSSGSGTVYQGSPLTVTATIGAVRNADTVVTLGSTPNPSGVTTQPATVTIPAGSTSATFQVTAGGTNGPVLVNGTLPTLPVVVSAAAAPQASLGLTVADQVLTLTPNPLSMAPSSTAVMTATINAAPSADAVVALTSTAPGVFTVPTSVTIPAGQTSATFTVTSLTGSGSGNAQGTLPATLDLAPQATATAAVNVNSLAAVISPPEVTSLMAGGGQLFTVTIPSAVAQPMTVQLASSASGNVSVPASIVIPAGSTSATFTAIAESAPTAGATITATLPAQFGGGSGTAKIDATIPLTISATPTTVSLPALTDQTIVVTTGTLLAKDVTIGLSSLNPVQVGMFDASGNAIGTLAMAAGTSSTTFKIRGLSPTTSATEVDLNTPTQLGGVLGPEAKVTVNVLTLQLKFSASTVTIALGGTVNVQVGLTDLSGNPVTVAVPVSVNLASSNRTIAYPTNAQVIIPASASNQTAALFGNSPGGPAVITGQLDASLGGATATLSAGVSIADPPTITAISPTSGTSAGGTAVTINGTLFWSGATVTFGGVAATNVVQVSPYQMTCTTPAHAAGAVDVVVTNPATAPNSATLSLGYTYVTPGTATIVLSPNPLVWHIGAASTNAMTIGISPVQATPTTITLLSSNAIVANPLTTVTIPASTATVSFDPFNASAEGSATITAQLPSGLGGGTTTADVTHFNLTFTPSTVTVGVGATVNVAAAAGTTLPNPISVGLSTVSPAISVPASVIIPTTGSATIPVTGLVTGGPATVDAVLPAGAGGDTITAAITATVAAPSWTVSPSPSVTFPIGGTQQFTLTLNGALASASTFLLSGGSPFYTYPASVVILAGQTSATFTVNGTQVGGPNTLTITAPSGYAPGTRTVDITISPLTLTVTPNSVGPLMAGGGHTFTLTINQAQPGALDVTLLSHSSHVTVPASVQIPAGATQTTFQAIAETVGGGPTYLVDATLPAAVGGATASTTITSITALTISASPGNVNIPAATEQEITVTTGVTLAKNVTLTIASGDPVIVGIFDSSDNATGSVTIPAGSNTGTFRVRGVGVGTGVGVRLDTPADLGGTAASEADVTVNVLALQLRFNVATISVAHGASTALAALEADLYYGDSPLVGGVVIPVTVRLTSFDPTSVLLWGNGAITAPGASPIDIVIPAGTNNQNFHVFGRSPGGPFAVTGQLLGTVGNGTATLQVGVTNPTAAWGFTIAPTRGSSSGGTTVAITASGAGAAAAFWNNVQVYFGGALATVTLQMPDGLTVTTPAGVGGSADVMIVNPTAPETVTNTGAFTYFTPFTLAAVTPALGPTTGGTSVVVSGAGFVPGQTYQLNFGGATASTTAASTTALSAVLTPAHAAGVVSLTVTDPILQTQTLANAFTYLAPPAVTNVATNAGNVAGGLSVTITGSGFLTTASYAVSFGATAASAVTVVNTTTITCTTPPHAAGRVTVTVDDSVNAPGSLPNAFTYYATPTLSGISVSAGDTGGGTAVSLTGTNFLPTASGGVYSVTFGGALASGISATSTTNINGTTPAHASGAVDVVVTDGAGQIATLTQAFIFYGTPSISTVSPSSGSLNGGAPGVTISGSGFVAGGSYTVLFGATPAPAPVTATGPGTITCTPPAHVIGPVTVSVIDPVHPAATLSGGYTYQAAFSIGVSSANGATASSVGSAPAGIACSVGTAGTCSYTFNSTPLTLSPTAVGPDTGWTWGGACAAAGCAANANCNLGLTADPSTCTLAFN